MKTFFFLFAMMLFSINLYSAAENTLIKGTSEHGIHCNYEVYIDTTGISGNFNSITLRDRVYSKSGYILILNDGTFNKQYDINGKPVKVQSLTLNDLSSEYRNDLLPKFELIIEKYGIFQIIYTPSLNSKEEEIEKKSAAYHLTFDTLIKANELLDYMNYTVGLPCDYSCQPSFTTIVPNIQNATNPEALKIASIAPVPISETGVICFSLSNDSKVFFSISNLIGNTSNSISVEKFFNPGDNCFELSFKDLSPGMYFITISDGMNSDTKNFIISR